MKSRVDIKLLSGEELSGQLTRTFNPASHRVELVADGSNTPKSFRFDEVAFIRFPGTAEPAAGTDANDYFENVTTVTGDQFHLRLKRGKGLPNGFYGYPTDPDAPFNSIFITNAGLRQRRHDRPIGQVLVDQGAVEAGELDAALSEQRTLRQRRVGEILVEQYQVPKLKVEENLLALRQKGGRYGCAKVGEILIEAGLVSRQQVDEALAIQAVEKRKRIGTILIELGLISEEQLLSALAQKFGLPLVDLDHVTPTPEALKCLSREILVKMQVIPLEIRRNRLVVATANPTDPLIAQTLRFAANLPIELAVASAGQIASEIARIATARPPAISELIDGLEAADVQVVEEQEVDDINESDSKVINLVNRVLIDAHRRGVSDIHFEPGMGSQPLKIRYRKDGICTQVHEIAAAFKPAIISRLKIIAKLDIAERRRPQSGKILLKHSQERIEYRVEVTPTIGGQEDAVLRVLSSAQIFPLEQIGFSTRNLERMREALKKPYGLILCVGPTGSGKTTTLHSCISEINTPDRKIWTAEDPVEITQEGLRQVQVHPKIGFTFEEALRSFLRADPDVIMIGEMRDPVTAKTAIGASLTGHLVFSTLHTNSAAETVVRLIEMGMDPFNFADALLGILAQRLAKGLCEHCKQAYRPDQEEIRMLAAEYCDGTRLEPESIIGQWKKEAPGGDIMLRRATGCEHCNHTGYRGRIGLHELMVVTPKFRHLIQTRAPLSEMQTEARAEGMRTLKQDGIAKVLLGHIDIAQVRAVCA